MTLSINCTATSRPRKACRTVWILAMGTNDETCAHSSHGACGNQRRLRSTISVRPGSESPTAGKPATATLSEQKMCSEQANKSFRESDLYSDKTAIGNSYTNHYDVAAKICFIETSSRHFAKNNFQYGHVIYDAFEGRVYGSFYSASSKPEVVVECMLCQSANLKSNAIRAMNLTHWPCNTSAQRKISLVLMSPPPLCATFGQLNYIDVFDAAIC